MPRIVPKDTPEAAWHQLPPNKDFAIRSTKEDVINIRLGQGQGVFLMIAPIQLELRAVHSINFEHGEPVVLAKLNDKENTIVGRTSECRVKIIHAIVSRQHLMLRFDGTILVVRDMGSTNGTYCHNANVCFDIGDYLAAHPIDKAGESTLDQIHEVFGPTLDDFLTRYSKEGQE